MEQFGFCQDPLWYKLGTAIATTLYYPTHRYKVTFLHSY
jgi:hypothetical protein